MDEPSLTQNHEIIEQGYVISDLVHDDEFKYIYSAIKDSWLSRILNVDQVLFREMNIFNRSMADYHLISSTLNHSAVWNKYSRILAPSFANWLYSSNLFNSLESLFGPIKISDEEGIGWPNIYWRLVRPNQPQDVGPLHRDEWFWKLDSSISKSELSLKRLKVWMPIIVEKGNNGLLVVPYSHTVTDLEWSSEHRHGKLKPLLTDKRFDSSTLLLPANRGQVIIFDDKLLHGGAVNRGDKCRVSLEFTIQIL